MKKIVVVGVLFVAVLVGSNMYFSRQLNQQLEALSEGVRSFGGVFTYSAANFTLGGSIDVEGITFFIPSMEDSLRIERISVESSGILGAQRMVRDLRKQIFPERLSLSVEGMDMSLAGANAQNLNALSEDNPFFVLSSCGKKKSLSESDYVQMGYGSTVRLDSRMDLSLMNNGQWMELQVKANAQDLYDITLNLDVTLNSTSRELTVLSAAGAGALLKGFVVAYQDKGFTQRLVAFCQQASGLSKDAFVSNQMKAWEAAWKERGFVVGETLVTAYQNFLQQPSYVRFSAEPLTEFGLKEIGNMATHLLPYQFRTQLEINDLAMAPLDITAMTEKQKSDWLKTHEEITTATSSTPAEPVRDVTERRRSGPRKVQEQNIEVGDLPNHLRALVELRLHNGQVKKGRIVRIDDDGIMLLVRQPGGSMEIPVGFEQIESATIK